MQCTVLWYACTPVKENGVNLPLSERYNKAVQLYNDLAVESFFRWVEETLELGLPGWTTHTLFGKIGSAAAPMRRPCLSSSSRISTAATKAAGVANMNDCHPADLPEGG